jgi:hypothetical protein
LGTRFLLPSQFAAFPFTQSTLDSFALDQLVHTRLYDSMNQQTEIHDVEKKAKLANGHGPNGHTNGHTNGDGPTHLTSQGCIDLEAATSASNYHPLPVVFAKAKGARVWDVEGRAYIDW